MSVGSLVAGVLWIVGSAVFSLYLEKYARYDATYGALSTAIGCDHRPPVAVIACSV